MSILFEEGKMIVRSKDTSDSIDQDKEEHGLYMLSTLSVHGNYSHSTLWHKWFGYVNFGTLVEVARSQMMDGLPPIAGASKGVC